MLTVSSYLFRNYVYEWQFNSITSTVPEYVNTRAYV